MAANVITYSDAISKGITIDCIYFDTNFINDLLTNIANPSISKPHTKHIRPFYDFLSKNKTEMWTSNIAVEEVMFIRFKPQISNEIDIFKKSKGLSGNLSYKDFQKDYRKDFESCYDKLKGIFEKLFISITGLNIKIKIPRDFSTIHPLSKGERIARYATCLLKHYYLDVADAFHVSTARCNGTKNIATNDLGFQQIDNITVFSFRQFK